MMATFDLFPHSIQPAARNDDERQQLALGLVKEWFGTLDYLHSESAHGEILDSLCWRGMPAFVAAAAEEPRLDFAAFAAAVRRRAQRARALGLVRPDGVRRHRVADSSTPDLFQTRGE